MKTMKGPGLFLAQFAGDEAPFNSLDAICRWAASLGYKGVQIPTWDARLFDLKKAADSTPIATRSRASCAAHGIEITELSTHLQGQLVAVHPAYRRGLRRVCGAGGARQSEGAAGMGGRPDADGGEGLEAPRPQRQRHLLGRARMAVHVSLAAASGRPRRDGLRGAGAPLAADPRRLSRRRAATSATRFIPARIFTTAPPSSASSMRSAATSAPASTTIRATSCCSSSTISPSSISITSASRRSTSRTRSSIRPAASASTAATRAGSTAPAASARSATGRSISARSSPSSRSTITIPGPCSNGNAA